MATPKLRFKIYPPLKESDWYNPLFPKLIFNELQEQQEAFTEMTAFEIYETYQIDAVVPEPEPLSIAWMRINCPYENPRWKFRPGKELR